MNPNLLFNEIKTIIPNLNADWKQKYALFLTDENLQLFSENLILFHHQKEDVARKPYFKDEIIVSIQDKMFYFENVLQAFEKGSGDLKPNLIKMFEETPFEILLLVLGQRLTSASRRNETGIPPLRKDLIESCFLPYNKDISVAARAWEKHVGRKKDSMFGEAKGNTKQKQETVEKLVKYIMDHKTWWNIFSHYKHGLVYEVRIENGQGLRWSADGKQFIGFLEDFLEE
ncbi:hypothetical protein [Flavobacterium limi]|uniref:HEPN AbiU2-like domain-containing protein n=1 Tax=Flavobacterium limi TaxID=2045105 RepID=A0ABQ1U7A7_9FLAO|nr:hypothetical protein [Flavobacterium limi]GGF11114.1 hypothetical protein GCM10011518_20370 [Flavobacterium limi]